jgi:hypothetical protein
MCGTVGSGGIARRRVQDSQCAARDEVAMGIVSGWHAQSAITSENEAEANWRVLRLRRFLVDLFKTSSALGATF